MQSAGQWQEMMAAAAEARAEGKLKAAGHRYAEVVALAWQTGPEAMDATLTEIVSAVREWTAQDEGADGLVSLGKRLLVVLEQVPAASIHPVLRYRRGEIQTLAYAAGLLGLIRSGEQPADELERLRPLALAHAGTFDQLTDGRWNLEKSIEGAFRDSERGEYVARNSSPRH